MFAALAASRFSDFTSLSIEIRVLRAGSFSEIEKRSDHVPLLFEVYNN